MANDADEYLSDEEELECPLCMEEFDISDRTFKPCTCGYQICRFCYNRIVNSDTANGCPACRRQYSEETVEFKPLSAEEWKKDQQRIQSRKLKEKEKRELEMASRRHLSNMRVVQKNLVYVIGFSPKAADADLASTLRGSDYFAQYGKINKIVVNKKSHPNGQPTVGVYITYARKEDAARAIQAVDNSMNDGRVLRASYGTTKYCSAYLRQQVCQNPNCMYLHEPGEDLDSYTREDMSTIQHAAKAAEGINANALATHHMRRQPSQIASTPATEEAPVALPPTVSWASKPTESESQVPDERPKPESLPAIDSRKPVAVPDIPPPPSQAEKGAVHPSDVLPAPVQQALRHPILGKTLKTLFTGRFEFSFAPRPGPGLTEQDIKAAQEFPQLLTWNPDLKRPSSPGKAARHARANSRYAFAADARTPPPGFVPPGLASGHQPPGFAESEAPIQGKDADYFAQYLGNNGERLAGAMDNAFLGNARGSNMSILNQGMSATNGRRH
ncbi:hypothetical protein BCR37DRAFT_384039 [Protomyces lactucae-debilis]|uniref:RING/Ubox like zinc-binding domain-domain-containing protein n=1 Tax=Protomyces lactucae-debilis TaxID=2754530 RepID=A0A1Y2EV16_PROLT|nr:uncharacterized protein BCR37DRAFT_384039 [Protomyces lactucae-debilis]ORY75410.1 hypothetical protein BCR37DRAFT_384039 [Protomyces lactucae-debilis]